MIADEVKQQLLSLSEPKYREFQSKIIPGCSNIVGVRMPHLRKIAKSICRSEWREFLNSESESYEFSILKAIIIGNADMTIDERIACTEEFVPEVTNWAINDCLCQSWSWKKGEDSEKLWAYCLDLMDRHEEFPSRIGAVMAMTNFIDDCHIDDLLEALVSLPRCGYYLDMGVAWALSFCYIKFPEKTEKAIFDGRLENEILRMTVRKICDSYRVEKFDKEKLTKRLKEER